MNASMYYFPFFLLFILMPTCAHLEESAPPELYKWYTPYIRWLEQSSPRVPQRADVEIDQNHIDYIRKDQSRRSSRSKAGSNIRAQKNSASKKFFKVTEERLKDVLSRDSDSNPYNRKANIKNEGDSLSLARFTQSIPLSLRVKPRPFGGDDELTAHTPLVGYEFFSR